MKVLIIEDEAPAFRRLQNLIGEIDPNIEIIDVIDSVDDSVKWFGNHSNPDLIFMDIQLADGISFEIFDQVKIESPVIFTTAYDEYTLRAFKVNSVDYLLKPINKNELSQSLDKWESLKSIYGTGIDLKELFKRLRQPEPTYKHRFLVKVSDRLISVEEKEVAYFLTKDNIIYLLTNKGRRYVMDQTLDELEQAVDPENFFRINRQYLVKLQAISNIHQFFKGKLKIQLVPPIEEDVIVSREKVPIFKRWLDK